MFFGSIPALVTPCSNGRVSEDTFADFVEWQIAEGSDALVPCGTTGESATLSRDEHREVIAHAVQIARGRVPVIAGCGSYSTAAVIEMVRANRRLGGVRAFDEPEEEGAGSRPAAGTQPTHTPATSTRSPHTAATRE